MRFAVAARWRAALRKAWRAAGLVLLSLLLLPAAWAESHALLIGVNEVGVLPPRLRLRGPANDVALMRQALISRGMPAPNITVLAQRTLLAMAAPTREIPDDYRITNCSERVVAFILSTVGRHKQWSGLR